MRCAVYRPSQQHALVLTPTCMQPSMKVARDMGAMAHLGSIEIGAELLATLADRPRRYDIELLVSDPYAHRYVMALIARRGEEPERIEHAR